MAEEETRVIRAKPPEKPEAKPEQPKEASPEYDVLRDAFKHPENLTPDKLSKEERTKAAEIISAEKEIFASPENFSKKVAEVQEEIRTGTDPERTAVLKKVLDAAIKMTEADKTGVFNTLTAVEEGLKIDEIKNEPKSELAPVNEESEKARKEIEDLMDLPERKKEVEVNKEAIRKDLADIGIEDMNVLLDSKLLAPLLLEAKNTADFLDRAKEMRLRMSTAIGKSNANEAGVIALGNEWKAAQKIQQLAGKAEDPTLAPEESAKAKALYEHLRNELLPLQELHKENPFDQTGRKVQGKEIEPSKQHMTPEMQQEQLKAEFKIEPDEAMMEKARKLQEREAFIEELDREVSKRALEKVGIIGAEQLLEGKALAPYLLEAKDTKDFLDRIPAITKKIGDELTAAEGNDAEVRKIAGEFRAMKKIQALATSGSTEAFDDIRRNLLALKNPESALTDTEIVNSLLIDKGEAEGFAAQGIQTNEIQMQDRYRDRLMTFKPEEFPEPFRTKLREKQDELTKENPDTTRQNLDEFDDFFATPSGDEPK